MSLRRLASGGAVVALLLAGPAVAQTTGAEAVAGVDPLLGGDWPFAPYAPALAALAGWALLMIVLALVSVRGVPRARSDSGDPVRDYSDPAYRRSRAHLNAIENAGPFIAATVAAVLAGAAPFWVNLFASLFLVARIAMAAVHVGTENQGLRSACFAAGLLCLLALTVLAFLGALGL